MGAGTTLYLLVIVALMVTLVYFVGQQKVRETDTLRARFADKKLDTMRIGLACLLHRASRSLLTAEIDNVVFGAQK